jgi:hypothetical protein
VAAELERLQTRGRGGEEGRFGIGTVVVIERLDSHELLFVRKAFRPGLERRRASVDYVTVSSVPPSVSAFPSTLRGLRAFEVRIFLVEALQCSGR